MAKLTIEIPDNDLALFRAAAARDGARLSPYVVRVARIGALWEDANRPRHRDDAGDLARAEEQAALDQAAHAAEEHRGGHAA
ncbi:hypothetical protein [Nocardia sp. alder85J]|uniref:hypothetical protein n=1 Tax=Nocardia sp. alder85J TaxID=2862949 RepID=UPI001CD4876C|nr:hypothetical protein [Nocardia sp. alder85J]MCX4099129.1 hypothetical protein [Nocardia sp. alder85J]